MPAPEIGRIERAPIERDIGRVGEKMSGRILDIDLGLPIFSDAQDSRRFVAAAEEIAAFVEGDSVGQAGQLYRKRRGLAGASVWRDSDPRDLPRERLADEKRPARRVERHAVGE